MMKLTLAHYAPNPRRVAMFLAEKGVADIAITWIDLGKGEHRAEAFTAKNAFQVTPFLELDDGRALTESRAICGYLESLYPEPNLFGRDAFERAHIEMWDRRVELMFAMPAMMWVRHGHPALAAVERAQDAAYAESSKRFAMIGASMLDRALANGPFVAGDRFTNADITLLAGVDFAKMNKWRPGADLPHLARWREAMAQRPCGQTPP